MFAARNMTFATAAASSYDSDAATYFAAIVTAGSSITTANKNAVNAFIVGCKSDSIWTEIKASCLLCAADDLTGALVPLVGSAPTNNNFVSGDYSRTLGLTGNALNKRLGSSRQNNADPDANAHVAVWCSSGPTSFNRAYIGNATAIGGRQIYPSSTTNMRHYCNITTGVASVTISSLNVTGLIGVTRNNSTQVTARLNQTNNLQSKDNATAVNEEIFMFATGATRYSDCRLSFYSIGESLNLDLLDARLTTLMAALT